MGVGSDVVVSTTNATTIDVDMVVGVVVVTMVGETMEGKVEEGNVEGCGR